MPKPTRQDPRNADSPEALADALHSAAIRLLRRLRSEDEAVGLSGPGLSALSVIVFNPGLSPSALAAAEQVSLPTISRLLKDLEAAGVVRREKDPDDARGQRLFATKAGERKFAEGRARRIGRLARALEARSEADRKALKRAAVILSKLDDL